MRSPYGSALRAVFTSSLGIGLVFGFQPPLIALILSRGGASSFAVGAVTAATLIAIVALGPLYPAVIARLGLRASAIAGIVGAAIVLLAMPAWAGVGPWLCLRLLTGCALGLSWIASEVWLNSMSVDGSRGKVMGIYGTVFSAGTMAGPAMLEWTGTKGWQPFAIGATCLLATLLPLTLLRQANGVPQPFTPVNRLRATLRRAPMVMAAALAAGLIESAELTLLPLFALNAGFSDRQALLLVTIFMAGNVFLQAPIGMLADRFGRRFMLACCAALSAIGPLLLLPWIATPLLLWPLLFIWGGTLYAFYSQGVALLGEIFPTAELPSANTAFVMVYCIGGVVGPSAGGWLMDAWPRHGMQALLSATAFLLLTGFVLSHRAGARS